MRATTSAIHRASQGNGPHADLRRGRRKDLIGRRVGVCPPAEPQAKPAVVDLEADVVTPVQVAAPVLGHLDPERSALRPVEGAEALDHDGDVRSGQLRA